MPDQDPRPLLVAIAKGLELGVFGWVSLRRGRAEAILGAIIGSLAFNITLMAGVATLFGTKLLPNNPALELIFATMILAPTIYLSLAVRNAKSAGAERLPTDERINDNIYAWTNFGRDAANFQLLQYRNVDGFLVTGKNSGTHWLKYMLSHAIAFERGLQPPQFFNGPKADVLFGHPRSLRRDFELPRIASSHNIPSRILSWRLVRRLFPLPPQVVLVRDMRGALISNYLKWQRHYNVPFSQFVRGDPAGRRFHCDTWWYVSFLNHWGDMAAAYPADTLIVRYEDLQRDPMHWLGKICAHLKIVVSGQALQAGIAAGEKSAVLASLDPTINEIVITDDVAKSLIAFSPSDLAVLRSIRARHLRYDFGYSYGLQDGSSPPLEINEGTSPKLDLSGPHAPASIP